MRAIRSLADGTSGGGLLEPAAVGTVTEAALSLFAAGGAPPAPMGAAAESPPSLDRAALVAILESITEGVVIYDESGDIGYVNRAAERMFKRPRRSLIGRDRRSARIRLHHMDGRPMRDGEGIVGRVLAGGHAIVGEDWRLLRPDRTLIDVTVSAFPLAGAAGSADRVVLTLTDTTERRRAESASRESEERLRAIVSSTLDGIVAVDGEGRIVEFNVAAEALFRRARAEVIGQPAQMLMPQRLRRRHAEAFAARQADPGKTFARRLETAAMRGDGTEVAVEVSMTRVRQEGRWLYVASMRELRPAP